MKTLLYKWAIIFSILLPLFPLLLAQPLLFEQTYGYQGGELFDFTIRNNTLYAISLDGVIQSEDAGNNWQLVLDLVRRLKKDIITATSEIPPSHLLKTFPNPAKDLLQFSSLQSGTVYDLTGRTIQQFSYQHNIDISQLQGGLYFIKFQDEYHSIHAFVKQ